LPARVSRAGAGGLKILSDGRLEETGRGRFLKKAAQKLFLCWVMGCVGDKAHDPES
jgi:hypothetical protein